MAGVAKTDWADAVLKLQSPVLSVTLHPVGARLVACLFDGVPVTVGPGPDWDVLAADTCSGAVCGRHAGRISQSQVELDGEIIRLVPNMGPHQIHGGRSGFHTRAWQYDQQGQTVTFRLLSDDGEEGYPGLLDVSATYTLTDERLILEIEANTSKTTVCNLTNHAFWNLAGYGSVLGHDLQIAGSSYFQLDEIQLPTGRIFDVEGTNWDFRRRRRIDADYDGAILLDGERGAMKHALTLYEPTSGRRLEVWTTEGVMQIYTAVHWNAEMVARAGPLHRSQALAIEPQNIADAQNHPHFPSSILRPGERYLNRMEWRFYKAALTAPSSR